MTDYCDACGARAELYQVQTRRQTHWSPAEYDMLCAECIPPSHDEYKAMRDDYYERKLDAHRNGDFDD